ncbi:VrrA/YqfQ family protein [Ornithinibacillus contaminans]|uniref:VrrA/YqfQ family protein n=1 Tax=Ornithinibacillus contaminans TaxID=694055 RepID=UPI00069D0387|nr:VrrA/YqfQ family protein [Ornithinibacillus contaminans]
MIFPNRQQPPMNNFIRPNNNFSFPGRSYQPLPARNNIVSMVQQFLSPNTNVTQVATKGVEGISRTLNGVQQVLRVVDTAAPMVKQYGPLVRNLPAMYRMMKAFKDIDTENEDSEIESETAESVDNSPNAIYEQDERPIRRSGQGQSTPKLFI